MIRAELVRIKEQALDRPFTSKLSEVVDRIDCFLDEEELFQYEVDYNNPGGMPK